MSTQISDKTDRLAAILESHRTGKLSEGLALPVVSIGRGVYVSGDKSKKPAVYVSDGRIGWVRDLAGGALFDTRLKYKLTGVVTAATQELAVAEAELLAANLLMVILDHSSDAGYWSGAGPGWTYPSDDDSGEDVLEWAMEVGDKTSIAHFVLLWSCNCRLSAEELETPVVEPPAETQILTVYPTTIVQGGLYGVSWTNLANAAVEDGLFAHVDLTDAVGSIFSRHIGFGGFDISEENLPDTEEILGFKFHLKAKASRAEWARMANLNLSDADGFQGTFQAGELGNQIEDTLTWTSWGDGSSVLGWTGITAADVRGTLFKAALQLKDLHAGEVGVDVDTFRLDIYHRAL